MCASEEMPSGSAGLRLPGSANKYVVTNLDSATFRDTGMGGGGGVLMCPAHKTGCGPAPACPALKL